MKISKLMVMMMVAITFPAVAEVKPFSANYNFNIEGKYNGTASRILKQNNTQWLYQMNANAGKLASATMTSTFNENNGIIFPQNSSTTYKILGIGRTEILTFDHAKKQYVSNYKGKTKTIKMPNIAFDDLGLEMQIREELKAGKFRGSYLMADRDKVEVVPFTKSDMTKISVPAGTFDVVRIDRVHDDKSRQTSFWLASNLDYLPIKVVQTNDGKKMEMNLITINH